jgi:hypothetical protein
LGTGAVYWRIKRPGCGANHPRPSSTEFNPLTPGLNPSAQHVCREFLLGILIFKGLTARRICKSFGVKGLRISRALPLLPSLSVMTGYEGDNEFAFDPQHSLELSIYMKIQLVVHVEGNFPELQQIFLFRETISVCCENRTKYTNQYERGL